MENVFGNVDHPDSEGGQPGTATATQSFGQSIDHETRGPEASIFWAVTCADG
jgi:hypothetical protein